MSELAFGDTPQFSTAQQSSVLRLLPDAENALVVCLDFDGTQVKKGITEAEAMSSVRQIGPALQEGLGEVVGAGYFPLTAVVTARTLPEAVFISGGHTSLLSTGDGLQVYSDPCVAVVAENGGVVGFVNLEPESMDLLNDSGFTLQNPADFPQMTVILPDKVTWTPERLHLELVAPVLQEFEDLRVGWSYLASVDYQELLKLQEIAGHDTVQRTKDSVVRFGTGYLKVPQEGGATEAFVRDIKAKASEVGVVVRADIPHSGPLTLEFESGADKGDGVGVLHRCLSVLYPRTAFRIAAFGDKDNDGPMFSEALKLNGFAVLVKSQWRSSEEGEAFVKECLRQGVKVVEKTALQGVIEGLHVLTQDISWETDPEFNNLGGPSQFRWR